VYAAAFSSDRVPGTEIERIYSKIGASSRSTTTLVAIEHGLLDSLEPLDLWGEYLTTSAVGRHTVISSETVKTHLERSL
jgi:hypothetical protein